MALINTTTTGVLGSTFFGDGTGPLTVQQNGVTLGVYGNIPAFSAGLSGGNQSISTNTWTKVQLNTKTFDTNNNFDSVTNYRFTPTVAGYYQINSGLSITYTTAGGSIIYSAIYKNGSAIKQSYSGYTTSGNVGLYGTQFISALIFMNGTTDYLELYGWANAGTGYVFGSGESLTWMDGYLAKAV